MSVVHCSVVKGDPPIEIIWNFNGTQLINNPSISITKPSQRISTLSIDAVNAEHRGQYTCSAKNPAGEAIQTSFLNVNGNNL